MTLHYRLNCDDYVLHDGEKPVAALLTEVAVVFSYDAEDGTWTRFKTGSPAGMSTWVAQQAAKMGADSDMVKSLRILEGKLPVDDLNRVMQNSACMESLLQKCQAIVDTQHLDHTVCKTIKLNGVSLAVEPFSMRALMPSDRLRLVSFAGAGSDDISDVVCRPALALVRE